MKSENTDKIPFKCFDCIMALPVPDGIWCLRFKGLATREIAAKCEDFVAKGFVIKGKKR